MDNLQEQRQLQQEAKDMVTLAEGYDHESGRTWLLKQREDRTIVVCYVNDNDGAAILHIVMDSRENFTESRQ